MSDKRFLALLQVFYQGINAISAGLKRLIDEVKAETK